MVNSPLRHSCRKQKKQLSYSVCVTSEPGINIDPLLTTAVCITRKSCPLKLLESSQLVRKNEVIVHTNCTVLEVKI